MEQQTNHNQQKDIPILNFSNYNQWRTLMMTRLMEKDLDKVVWGNENDPSLSQSLSLSTQVNVSDSDISRHVSEPDRPPTTTNELADNNVQIVEMEKLREELESIRKEQDALISLLGDQNLKLQYYEKEFKNRGLESVCKKRLISIQSND